MRIETPTEICIRALRYVGSIVAFPSPGVLRVTFPDGGAWEGERWRFALIALPHYQRLWELPRAIKGMLAHA